jgi:hypothetical protein
MGNKVSLRDYFDALRTADLRANDIATKALDRRLDLLNELRGNVLSRDEYLAKHEALEAEISALRDRVNRSEGKGQGFSSAWAIAVAVVTIMIAIAAVVVVVVVHG